MAESNDLRDFRNVPAMPGIRAVYTVGRSIYNILGNFRIARRMIMSLDKRKIRKLQLDSIGTMKIVTKKVNGNVKYEVTVEFDTREDIEKDDLIIVETMDGKKRIVNWHNVHRGMLTIEEENNVSDGSVMRRHVTLKSCIEPRDTFFFDPSDLKRSNIKESQ